ncbi:MAG: hypothetical protein Q8S20_11770 [Sulfuritalea sp.]|jgi:hypothetical protein|nr:hypothetical protein [Sulfuritalea sp.]
MNSTVFLTVLSGVITFVIGQLIVKLVIEPVQEMKKTIGLISHSMIEHANVIGNPGVPSDEMMRETSKHLRQLSSQLQAHLYLVPQYQKTAKIFGLPGKEKILAASGSLLGLSNSVFRVDPSERIYEQNAKRVELVCDSLGIYMAEGDRLPKDQT